ncbi:MAG TPA: hypothetical protein HPP94_09565 [Desulfuromonadales bacterium]|nr:hypothetical protein [Desulfuromonadales bacterium]
MTPEQFLDATRRAKFHSLMTRYGKLHDEGRGDADESLDILAEALTLCPPEFKTKLDEITTEVFGKMPTAEYCDDDGNPCYSIPQLEKWLGHKIDPKDIERVKKRHPSPGTIHRLQ